MSYAAKPVPIKEAKEEGSNPLAFVSLILGIVGLVSGGCPFSLAAAITGWMGMKREPSGQAKIGFWLGVAGMILQLVIGLFILLAFGAAFGIGYTTLERQPGPPMPAPTVVVEEFGDVEVVDLPPMVTESAPASRADSTESMVDQEQSELGVMPDEPAMEEVPETAP